MHARLTAHRPLLVATWTVATALGLAVAATTRIGAVVLMVTPAHGVHLGDVLAFVVGYAAALLVTLGVAIAG